jgi:hypothetical protein
MKATGIIAGLLVTACVLAQVSSAQFNFMPPHLKGDPIGRIALLQRNGKSASLTVVQH